jgi:DNA-binding CsgD family transcriptional regulator
VARDTTLLVDLIEALGSSLDLGAVFDLAYPRLLRLVSAEYGALGLSATGRPSDYRWLVAGFSSAFFAEYAEMAPHDFVRHAVERRPNVVLVDSEMLPRAQVEANMLYLRARELGMPLEQGMAVMLHVDDHWQSGLALYRERRRAFSARERALLQRVTPAVANAVRNCHLFGVALRRGDVLAQCLDAEGAAIVITTAGGVEVARNAAATKLLDRWFAPFERRAGGVPDALLALLAREVASSTSVGAGPEARHGRPETWRRDGAGAALEARPVPLPAIAGPGLWALSLRELPGPVPCPAPWQTLLTQREREVASRVLRGWNNRLIAEDIGCAEGTVKKHLQSVFDKLGVQSRTALVASAAMQRSRAAP